MRWEVRGKENREKKALHETREETAGRIQLKEVVHGAGESPLVGQDRGVLLGRVDM